MTILHHGLVTLITVANSLLLRNQTLKRNSQRLFRALKYTLKKVFKPKLNSNSGPTMRWSSCIEWPSWWFHDCLIFFNFLLDSVTACFGVLVYTSRMPVLRIRPQVKQVLNQNTSLFMTKLWHTGINPPVFSRKIIKISFSTQVLKTGLLV